MDATQEDVEALRKRYPQFHPLDFDDVISHMEHPKLDEYDDYLLTVMQFPLWDPTARVSRPSEVDMFVGMTYLITVHDGKLKPLTNLFDRCSQNADVRELYMGRGAGHLFCAVIDQLVDYIFPILYKVDANIHRVEENIFDVDTQLMIRDISVLRRDNIALRRIVRPQIEILANLEKAHRPFISEDLDVYFGDIRDHLHKALDHITEHSEIIIGLSDTLNTLANYRTNEIVHILTVISVVLLPLSLISGIYGMNIGLPYQEHPASFLMVAGIMLATALSMLAVFRWRGWL